MEYLYAYISQPQKDWLTAHQNSAAVNYIYSLTAANNYDSYSMNLTRFIIDYLRQHPNATFEQFQNWFMAPIEGKDFYYDATFWENPNLSFEHQDLPSWADFDAAYPRNADGTYMTGADNVYGHVGGDVLAVRLAFPLATTNTCALKVSIALNYSGIVIPQITTTQDKPGTVRGADGKYYFLNAKSLNAWMRETFGTFPDNPNHYHFTSEDGGTNGENFPTLVAGLKGIFSMVSYNQAWASGHADILNNSSCAAGCHFQDTPAAPIEFIDIWVLE